MSAVDVLIVGAHPPALIGLRDHVGQAMHGSVFGLSVAAKVCGVGMGVAGALTAKRLVQLEPRAVVLIGTTGLYPGVTGFQPMDVVVADEIKLLDHHALTGRAGFPDPMHTQVSTPTAMSVFQAKIASPLSDTRDTTLAATVPSALGCSAESLEAFAFAQACTAINIPFGIVLGVSHVLGEHAMSDWQRYQRDASRAASTTVLNWIHAGAPGLPHRARA